MNAFDKIDELDRQFFDALRDKYVPASGAAVTVGGEIIRAMDRVIYRYWNDGDRVGEGYGNETCNSSYRYLCGQIGDAIPGLCCVSDYLYPGKLLELAQAVKDFLVKHAYRIFATANPDDSRTPSAEDYEAARRDEGYYDDEEDW